MNIFFDGSMDTFISHWWKKYTFFPKQKKNKPHIITSSFRFSQACRSRSKFMTQSQILTDKSFLLVFADTCTKSISDTWVKEGVSKDYNLVFCSLSSDLPVSTQTTRPPCCSGRPAKSRIYYSCSRRWKVSRFLLKPVYCS